jgi:hypothetical protein
MHASWSTNTVVHDLERLETRTYHGTFQLCSIQYKGEHAPGPVEHLDGILEQQSLELSARRWFSNLTTWASKGRGRWF